MKKKVIITCSIIAILLITTLVISNNTSTNTILVESYENINTEGLAFYLENDSGEYDSVSTIPSKDDGYIFKEAVCNDSSTVSFNSFSWSLSISNMEEGRVRCKLYFDIDDAIARKYILSQNTVNEGTPDFSEIDTGNHTGTLYTSEDDTGISYYYRGAVSNNYFYFAGYYWRIIRINGDGTLRIIYQGTTPSGNGIISNSKFNESSNNNAYLGYMYKTGEVHGTENSSTLKTTLENWYESSISEEYKQYVNTEQGFCNDRNNSTSMEGAPDDSGGTGTTESYYGARHRVFNLHEPSFKCNETNDLFTVASSNTGNKKLSQPIGTITVDEVAFAGGVFNQDNTSYYLNTGTSFWIMSPSHFSSNVGYPYNMTETGSFYRANATTSIGARPVININKDVELEGTGTSTDPYKIKDTEIEVPDGKTMQEILADYNIGNRGSFSEIYTKVTTKEIYRSTDNYGTTYYFAGAPTDNWVRFGGFYWRIIRVNGDGSIRLIYSGDNESGAITTGKDTQIGTSSFNSNYDDNKYVGFIYDRRDSSIKYILDEWYNNNLLSYQNYIANGSGAGFCNDRSLYSGDGIGQHASFYQGRQRLKDLRSPSFRCTDSEDWLDVVIGLITADEVAFAGGLSGNTITYSNDKYYLYTGNSYWTMTPSEYTDANPKYSAQVFPVLSDGGLGSAFVGDRVSYSYGVRPVINLKADTKFWGSGTSTDPYVVN